MKRVNSTTVNLVLTLRKAASLAISVWFYGSGFSLGLGIGGTMVLSEQASHVSAFLPLMVFVSGNNDILARAWTGRGEPTCAGRRGFTFHASVWGRVVC